MTDIDFRWWQAEKKTVHERLANVVDRIERIDTQRRIENNRLRELYEGRPFRDQFLSGFVVPADVRYQLININVIESCIDTWLSKLTEDRPRPMFVTDRGNYEQQQRAKRLDDAMQGQIYGEAIDDICDEAILDAGRTGTGVIKVYSGEDEVCYERVFDHDIHVDPMDALMGKPRSMFQVDYVDKDVLLERWPSKESIISSALPGRRLQMTDLSAIEQIRVAEGWRLPSGKGHADGRHVITIDGGTLLDEPWTHDRFPFAFMRAKPRTAGFWGKGIAEMLEGLQLDITDTVLKLRDSENCYGHTRGFLPRSAKIDPKEMTNEVGDLAYYDGPSPPVFATPQVASPEVYQYLERKIQRAFELVGLSQQSAQGVMPASLSGSGRSQIVYHNIESKRFVKSIRAVERFYCDLAECTVDAWEDIFAHDPKALVLRRAERRGFQQVNYADVRLDRENYTLRVFPVNSLPSEIAGKMAIVKQWQDAGWITADRAKALLDMPDLESDLDVMQESYEFVQWQLSKIMETGEPQKPRPYGDLADAQSRAQAAVMRSERTGMTAEIQDALRQYLDDVVDLLTPPAPPAPPPGATPPMPAPMPGGAVAPAPMPLVGGAS